MKGKGKGKPVNELNQRSCGVRDAAEYLGVPQKTLYRWLSEKRIQYCQIRRKILIEFVELDRFYQKHKVLSQSDFEQVN